MQQVQAILPIGTVVRDRYVIEDLLGKGGFGAVYLVRDQRVKGNAFALKETIDPNKQERQKFIFEGEVLRRLDHSALPHVYRTFEEDKLNRAYLLMDYIQGTNLEILRKKQPERRFSLPQVLTIMAPIFDAIMYLHTQQPPIIHRDVKPANIILSPEGNSAALVDFGIAKEVDPEATTTANRWCSPGYGAPEQYSRGTDTRTDIYGLAATMYVLLTGVIPTDALYRLTQLASRESDPLEPVNKLAPDVPQPVADAIAQAMAINIHERFSTVQEFWEALSIQPVESIAARPIVTFFPLTPPPKAKQASAVAAILPIQKPLAYFQRRAIVLLIALLILLIGLASTAGFFYYTRNHPSAAAQTTPTAIVGQQPTTGISPTAKPSATVRPTPTAHPSPTPIPTPIPTIAPPATSPPPPPVIPNATGNYNGTLHNDTANITTTMSLSIQQSGGNINGFFTVGPKLIGSGPFSGIIDTVDAIQFTVQSYRGNPPLFFYGSVLSDGSLSGQYCSLDTTTGLCNFNIGGHGSWQVPPHV